MSRYWNSTIGSAIFAFILQAIAFAEAPIMPTMTNFCAVVASPAEYSGREILVEGILSPGEHSLVLYSPSCKPSVDFDATTQAVFPAAWDSWPHAKRLQKILRKKRNAHVILSGTFESGARRYGPDVARFRFTISGIASVEPTRNQ